MTTAKRINVGDRVRIHYPTPPDEVGTVEAIYPATKTHVRRVALRQADGKLTYRAVADLEPYPEVAP